MKFVSVVAGCYNEEDNVDELYRRVVAVFEGLPEYRFELVLIDNASTDGTVARIKALANQDPRVKLIVNARNFGHVRSPFYGTLQASGEAVIAMASDLQDPPELIPAFLKEWEAGYKVVMARREGAEESPLFFALRSFYYLVIDRMSDVRLPQRVTGFGLYDRQVMDVLKQINDPYPYMRGLVAEIGFERAYIPYHQPARKHGITKNNFHTLYDLAMLGMTSHSKVPLRLATMCGFLVATLSLLLAAGYIVAKLVMWNDFNAGQAPTVIGLFFLGSVQLIFMGILGEYIGAIHTQVTRRPLVIEKERVNFDVHAELTAPARGRD